MNLQRLLKRRPDDDEVELDEFRRRMAARIAAVRGAADAPPTVAEERGAVSPPDDAAAEPPAYPDVASSSHAQPGAAHLPPRWVLFAPLDDAGGRSEGSLGPPAPASDQPVAADPAVPIEAGRPAAPPAAVPETGGPALPVTADSPAIDASPKGQPVTFGQPRSPRIRRRPRPRRASPRHDPAEVGAVGSTLAMEPVAGTVSAPNPAETEAGPSTHAGPSEADAWPRPETPASEIHVRAEPVDPTEDSSAPSVHVEPSVYCPYCASLLHPPPDTTRRCPRCRQRIVVRHVGSRVVHLTEAALPFFEAERRREIESERRALERARWLELARNSGAAADWEQHPEREFVTEADVAAARALYLSTVDRSFRTARSERRWEEAAGIRYDEALLLFRIAGSKTPPPDEVVKLHREGIAADLHGIGEFSKNAQLRAAPCCEICRADEGRVVGIAEELRSSRLPHRGCPTGVCGCRWFLTARDQEFLRAFLRRQSRVEPSLQASTQPLLDDAVPMTD